MECTLKKQQPKTNKITAQQYEEKIVSNDFIKNTASISNSVKVSQTGFVFVVYQNRGRFLHNAFAFDSSLIFAFLLHQNEFRFPSASAYDIDDAVLVPR